MSGKLGAALPSRRSYRRTELKVGYGSHRGYFLGLGEKTEEETPDRCKVCKGQGVIEGQECRACKGSGRRRMTKVQLLYQLGPNLVQDEWVTFIISGPGKLESGLPKSPSNLWTRMRALSDGLTDPDEIDAWYSNLPEPIRIPIEMMVTDNPNGDGCVIASIRRLHPREKEQSREPEAERDDVTFGDDEIEI